MGSRHRVVPLDELARVLRLRGCTGAELWVYEDNDPAVALYQKLGWRFDGPTRTHPRSGRTERH
jgi:GNAT superfamily N-acetyltransferase